MVNVKISENLLLDMFEERLEYWESGRDYKDLFLKMYENYISDGLFENMELDIMQIVDNDVINYCQVLDINDFDNEDEFKRAIRLYNEGYRDVSCDGFVLLL